MCDTIFQTKQIKAREIKPFFEIMYDFFFLCNWRSEKRINETTEKNAQNDS